MRTLNLVQNINQNKIHDLLDYISIIKEGNFVYSRFGHFSNIIGKSIVFDFSLDDLLDLTQLSRIAQIINDGGNCISVNLATKPYELETLSYESTERIAKEYSAGDSKKPAKIMLHRDFSICEVAKNKFNVSFGIYPLYYFEKEPVMQFQTFNDSYHTLKQNFGIDEDIRIGYYRECINILFKTYDDDPVKAFRLIPAYLNSNKCNELVQELENIRFRYDVFNLRDIPEELKSRNQKKFKQCDALKYNLIQEQLINEVKTYFKSNVRFVTFGQ